MSDSVLNILLRKVLNFKVLLMYFLKSVDFKLQCFRIPRAPTLRIALISCFWMRSVSRAFRYGGAIWLWSFSVISFFKRFKRYERRQCLYLDYFKNCLLTGQISREPWNYFFETNTFKNLIRRKDTASKLRRVCG